MLPSCTLGGLGASSLLRTAALPRSTEPSQVTVIAVLAQEGQGRFPEFQALVSLRHMGLWVSQSLICV